MLIDLSKISDQTFCSITSSNDGIFIKKETPDLNDFISIIDTYKDIELAELNGFF